MLTTYLENLGNNTALSLLHNEDGIMLFALTRPSRSAHLSKLDLNNLLCEIPEGILLQTTGLAQQHKPLTELFFPTFPDNPRLYPVWALPRKDKTPEGGGRCTDNRAFPCQLSNHTGQLHPQQQPVG